MLAETFEFNPQISSSFVEEVMSRSGQKLTACYQCRKCASGCPVCDETCGVSPDHLIRMILMGDRENALSNELIWKCVSCFTCGTRCPNNIKTGKITETLRKMTLEAGIAPLRPEIAHFHTSFFNESLRWGRINEMGMMGEYELRNTYSNLKRGKIRAIFAELKEQTIFAWKMFRLRRLHFAFVSSKGVSEINRLHNKSAGRTWK